MKPCNAMSNQTVEELERRLDALDSLSDEIYDNDNLYKDLTSRFNVDFENVDYIDEYSLPGTRGMPRYEMIGSGEKSFPVAWIAAGGDWQMPVALCIYIGETGELRGFAPNDGNAYDRTKNEPYSASDEGDDNDMYYVFSPDKMREDVAREVQVTLN